jgi:D-arabinose 1-dehydrogenase-like Zn-dependent alcohol dehydrogenase
MKKINYILIALTGAGVVGVAASGVANAASTNVASSGIPRSTFKQERLEAASQVLNTSTNNIQTARKAKTLKTLIVAAGLNKKTFNQKLRTQLITDLEAKGYSKDQITIALQHRVIVHLKHI